MSYINWGHESPEQLEIRRQLEQQALYEQAVRVAQAKQKAGQFAVGGGGDSLTGLYGVGVNGFIYNLNRGEIKWSYNYDSFPDITQITLNTDDGFLYAILNYLGDVYFIRIDKVTREFTFIENNISDYTVKGASSLYYEENGKFIYLDNFVKKSISSIVRISLIEGSPEFAEAIELSEVDPEETGYLLRNLFLYEGETWGIAYLTTSPGEVVTGPFDIDSGTFIYYNTLEPSPNESNISSIESILGVVEYNGIVYVDVVWSDLENNTQFGLFKMDTENGGISSPYYLKFIKDLVISSANDTAIVSITHF